MSRGPHAAKSITPEGGAELAIDEGKKGTSLPKQRNSRKSPRARVVRKENFRAENNIQEQQQITNSILRDLYLDDRTSISAIKTQSSIHPTVVSVSFRVLPVYLKAIWGRLESVGTRPFAVLNTPANYLTYAKVFLHLCEAKVSIAQMRCRNLSNTILTSKSAYDEHQLGMLAQCAMTMPYPMAMVVASLGNFESDQQLIVPILAQPIDDIPAGAVNFAPTFIRKLLHCLTEEQPSVSEQLASIIATIPGVTWDDRVRGGVRRIRPESVAFWEAFPSGDELTIFSQINASLSSKRGFNVTCNIWDGSGTATQAVRFCDAFIDSATCVPYYSMIKVSDLDMQFAPAIQLGFEHRCKRVSRLNGDRDFCLLQGDAVPFTSTQAVVWSGEQ